ncbi:hypothetical protein [Acuticoccus sediminis]|nr:hypothetical protein [Acuticoccus sediminis]
MPRGLRSLLCRLIGHDDVDEWETSCANRMIAVVRRCRWCGRQRVDLLDH